MDSSSHNYAVIMAGGSGTRLWPMSRKSSPKQFQALFDSQKTMIQLMYGFLAEVFPIDKICVQTDKRFAHFIEEQLPELLPENIFLEPEARDTGPAFGFSTATLLHRDPAAKIGVFYSDHIINDKKDFIKAVECAYQTAWDFPDFITMIGVKPTYPHTGLGYIKIKDQAKSYANGSAFYVDRFIEKPDLETAEQFTKSWEYFWNTGYKVYSASHLLNLIKNIEPEMGRTLETIAELMHSEADPKEIAELYKTLPKISFEYLITEKNDKLLVIPSDMEWSDIGDWNTLHEMLSESNGHDVVSKGNHISINTKNSLVYSGERLVATLGLRDVIIVDTGDVILVANKHELQDMKQLITVLKEQNKHTYL